MRVAEAAGSLVLAGARFAWPRLLAAWRALRALVRTLERVVTPARATAVVALCAAGVLAGSQFTEYRAVRVGDTQYQPVETVAPAPQVAEKDPRTAHGNWLLVVAAVSGVIVAISYGGRWRMARLLFPLGLVAVAVAVFGDHDTGLNAGQAGNSYEGAKAVLLDGYWTQIVAGAMLALCGPLLSRYLRMREAPSRSRAKAGRRSGRRGHAGRSRAVRTVG
jgi:hypothetical protein